MAAHGQTLYTSTQSSILSPLFIACRGEMQDFPFPLRLRLCWTLNVFGSGTRIKGQRLAGGVGTIPGGFQCPCLTSLRASFQNRVLLKIAFNVEKFTLYRSHNVRTIIYCEQVQCKDESVDGLFFTCMSKD